MNLDSFCFWFRGEKQFWSVRGGQLSLCSQKLLLPLGIPPRAALVCFTLRHFHDSEVPRTLDVGSGTQAARGVRITKCCTSVVQAIPGILLFQE